MLEVSTISDIKNLSSIFPEWDSLHAEVSPRVPFSSSAWCSTWWTNYSRDGLLASDQMRVQVLRDPDGTLVGVAPMFITYRPGRGPIRSRELQFFGADTYVTELRGPLSHPERAVEVFTALYAHLHAANEHDLIQWRGLRLPSDIFLCSMGFEADPTLSTIDYYLPLAPTWDAFRAELPRNIKESLRKCYNSLSRDNRSFELRVCSAPSDLPAALDRFFELHKMRADAAAAVRHPDVFATATSRRFLSDYCALTGASDQLRIFELAIDGQVATSRLGFIFADELYLYFSGYDLALAKYSVMTTTLAEIIKWAISNRFKLVNLSTGTDVSKTRWRPQSITYFGGYSVAARPRSQIVSSLLQRLRAQPQAR